MASKVCPIVPRTANGAVQLLAFRHPSAGKQFVKGTIERGETAAAAAMRELEEESGVRASSKLLDMGEASIGATRWHFFACEAHGLEDQWQHRTHDDHGHIFSFFWHPLAQELDHEWHRDFHEALEVIRQRLQD